VILEPTGSFASLDDLGKTIISPGNSEDIIHLGDVTTIYRSYVDPARTLVWINGEPGLVLGVSLKKGGNIITLGHQVEQKINEYLETYPIGVDLFRVASLDQEVATALQTALSGSTVDYFREGDKEIPIVMRSRLGETITMERLETLPVFSQAKQVSVPLKQVANIGVTWQATKILRRDFYKTMTVSCNLGKTVTAKEITDQIKPWLEKEQQA